jgi:hypothetical protein
MGATEMRQADPHAFEAARYQGQLARNPAIV